MDESGQIGSRQELICEIMRYLLQYPEAKDTVEGVMQWWVPKGEAEYRRKDVEEVLDTLVARGWITKRLPADSLYSLNMERVAEISESLREQDERNGPKGTGP